MQDHEEKRPEHFSDPTKQGEKLMWEGGALD